jgi:hypothetical protein
MTVETIEVFKASKEFEERVLMCFDDGYASGFTPEYMAEDLKKEVAASELGEMDYSIDCIMKQWKEDRGLV